VLGDAGELRGSPLGTTSCLSEQNDAGDARYDVEKKRGASEPGVCLDGYGVILRTELL